MATNNAGFKALSSAGGGRDDRLPFYFRFIAMASRLELADNIQGAQV